MGTSEKAQLTQASPGVFGSSLIQQALGHIKARQSPPGYEQVGTTEANTSAWSPTPTPYTYENGALPTTGVTQVNPAISGQVPNPAASQSPMGSNLPISLIPEGGNLPLVQRTPPTGVSNPYTQQNAQPYQPQPQMQQQQQQMQMFYQQAMQQMIQQQLMNMLMRQYMGGGMGMTNPYAYRYGGY